MLLNKVHKAFFSLCLCTCLLAPSMQALGALNKEYQIKAALIYHFIGLTQWPENLLAGDATLEVCLPDNPDFYQFFEDMISKPSVSTAQNKKLVIEKLRNGVQHCDVVYLTSDSLPEGKLDCQCLIIGDSPNFAIYGAFINFIVGDSRVGFQIHQELALNNQFVFDEKLLKMATSSAPQ